MCANLISYDIPDKKLYFRYRYEDYNTDSEEIKYLKYLCVCSVLKKVCNIIFPMPCYSHNKYLLSSTRKR